MEKGCFNSYCQWIIDTHGSYLEWNGGEKFYNYVEWLEYLIKKFFKPKDIQLNGRVKWRGEESGDIGIIEVKDNKSTVKDIDLETIECPMCNYKFKI